MSSDIKFRRVSENEARVYQLCRVSVYEQLSRSGPAGTSRRTGFAQHYVSLSSPH